MSLETQTANLETSANANAPTGEWGVAGYTTLEVGPGKPYPTIQAALDSLVGKTLDADVMIKVADGVHTANAINLAHQPYAQRIRIEGNVANPDACILRWTADANNHSHGFIADGVRGVNISGFRMEGTATATHWTHRHIMAINGAQVFCDPGTNKFVGGGRGLEATSDSVITCRECAFEGVVNAVIASQGGIIYAEDSNILGAGRDTVYTRPDGGSERAYGVWASNHGKVYCQGSAVDNVYVGYIAITALIHASSGRVSNADTAYFATESAVTWASAAKALDCGTGYLATASGLLMATSAVAENCTMGFEAIVGGKIGANGSTVKHCTTGYAAHTHALIEAHNTSANAVDTPTLYTPADSGVPDNDHAMIRQD